MGEIEELQLERRHSAIEELRSHSVGKLIQIIDELGAMDLSVGEIEIVLRTCGLNNDCAIRFGSSITFEKEKGRDHRDRHLHP